jgi:hypothetical protein
MVEITKLVKRVAMVDPREEIVHDVISLLIVDIHGHCCAGEEWTEIGVSLKFNCRLLRSARKLVCSKLKQSVGTSFDHESS